MVGVMQQDAGGGGPVMSARNTGKAGRQLCWAEFKVKRSIYHFVFQTKLGIFQSPVYGLTLFR